jgi:hypothetical protein
LPASQPEPQQTAAQPTGSAARDAGSKIAENSKSFLPDLKNTILERLLGDWLYLLAGAVVIVLIILGVRRNQRETADSPPAVQPAAPARSQASSKRGAVPLDKGMVNKQFQHACSEGDKKAVADALLKMAAASCPAAPPATLPALAGMLARGAEEVLNLDRAMYAASSETWNAKQFYSTFRDGLVFKTDDRRDAEKLASLYPDYS